MTIFAASALAGCSGDAQTPESTSGLEVVNQCGFDLDAVAEELDEIAFADSKQLATTIPAGETQLLMIEGDVLTIELEASPDGPAVYVIVKAFDYAPARPGKPLVLADDSCPQATFDGLPES